MKNFTIIYLFWEWNLKLPANKNIREISNNILNLAPQVVGGECLIIFNFLNFIGIIMRCDPQVFRFCANISFIQRGPNFHFNAGLRIKFYTICKICIFWVMKQQTPDFNILISPVKGAKMIVVRGINKTPPIRLNASDWFRCSLHGYVIVIMDAVVARFYFIRSFL